MNSKDLLEAVRGVVNGKKPNIDISGILYKHKCYYLLSKISTFKRRPMFEAERGLNRIAAVERYKTCQPLFDKLGVPYAVIKGAALSDRIYGDPAMRFSGDIDILIRRKDADAVKEILLSLGFLQGRIGDEGIVPFTRQEILFQATMSHQTAPYIKKTSNRLCPFVNVDVNMDVMWGESHKKSDMDFVLAQAEKTSLFGVDLYRLASEMEFVSLCLHHYKDMNSIYLLSGGSFRLGLFCDIYYYLRHVHPDVQRIGEICSRLTVGSYVYSCLYYTNQIFVDPLLSEYLDVLESQKDPALLDTFGLSEKERRPWGIPLEERLLHTDLSDYIDGLLDDADREKIQFNYNYM